MKKILFHAPWIFCLFVIATQAFANISVTENDVAIGGFDPVAYFLDNQAVKGDPQLRLRTDDGIFWLFKNDENQKLFIANPDKYTPQYGGYCAFAMGYRVKAKADPTIFTLHNGKLYLNQSELVKKRWLKKRDTLILLADGYWPRFK